MNANGTNDAVDSGPPRRSTDPKQGGNVVASTTTDASGNYSFSLKPGTYTFNEVCPSVGAGDEPWRQSKPTPNSDAAADCGTGTYTETLTSNGRSEERRVGKERNGRKRRAKLEALTPNRTKDAEGAD